MDNRGSLRDRLSFHRVKEDEYWAAEGLVFELFFSADNNGPSNVQLDHYLDFQERSVKYMDLFHDKAIDLMQRESGTAQKELSGLRPMVDVVNINKEGDEADFDVVASYRMKRFIFFSKWLTFVGKYRDGRLISLNKPGPETNYQT